MDRTLRKVLVIIISLIVISCENIPDDYQNYSAIKVLFMSMDMDDDAATYHLYSKTVSNTENVKLIDTSVWIEKPVLSNNQSMIAYYIIDPETGEHELMISDLDNKKTVSIDKSLQKQTSVNWSNNDNKLLYIRRMEVRPYDYILYQWDLKTQKKQELVQSEMLHFANISPAGNQIAFYSEKDLSIYNLDNHEIKNLDTHLYGFYNWYSDDNFILISSKDSYDSWQIFKTDLNGLVLDTLTHDRIPNPDSNKIAIVKDGDTNYLYPRYFGSKNPIVNTNGTRIIYEKETAIDSTEIWCMDSDGNNKEKLTEAAKIRWIDISKDGKYMVFTVLYDCIDCSRIYFFDIENKTLINLSNERRHDKYAMFFD